MLITTDFINTKYKRYRPRFRRYPSGPLTSIYGSIATWLLLYMNYDSCNRSLQFFGFYRYVLPHNLRVFPMGPLPDTKNCGLRMRRECRERFPRHRFQRKLLVSDPDMHHGTCVTHVPWCMSGSLNRGGGGKRSRHSRRMRNSQFYVSGKRPMKQVLVSRHYSIWFNCSFLISTLLRIVRFVWRRRERDTFASKSTISNKNLFYTLPSNVRNVKMTHEILRRETVGGILFILEWIEWHVITFPVFVSIGCRNTDLMSPTLKCTVLQGWKSYI